MFELSLKGQVAWVTGGSRGIGRSIALSLAKAGCDVAISYRSKESEAKEVCDQISAMGVKAFAVQTDVSDLKSVEVSYAEIVKNIGAVSILVNSAGVTADRLFITMESEDWNKVIGTNLMGCVHSMKVCMRTMMSKRFGRVINISSVAATRGGKGQANYAASKGAVEAMTRSLAVEMGSRGITFNCIAPGVIETDMAADVIKLGGEEIIARQIIKRFGKTDEIAAWAVMLASEYGGFITGQVIHLDGGLKMA